MKLPFGLIQGRLVSINEVQAGRACEALCPSCLGPLVARKGQVLVHHFAHDGHQTGPGGRSPCTLGYRVALQKMAGQLLSDGKKLNLPPLTIHAEHHGRFVGLRRKHQEVVAAGATLAITQILYNPTLSPDAQPSLLCTLDGFGPLAIELNMTGLPRPKAKQAYARLSVSCIEIDFSEIARPKENWLPTENDIRELLYDSKIKRTWIYHRDAPAIETALKDALTSEVLGEERKLREKRKLRERHRTPGMKSNRQHPVRQPKPPPRPSNTPPPEARTTLWAYCRPCRHCWEVDISSGRPSTVTCPMCQDDVNV